MTETRRSVTLLAVVLLASAPLISCSSPTPASPRQSTAEVVVPSSAPSWSRRPIVVGDLQRAGRARVLFAHQSVGGNVLKGVRRIFEESGVTQPVLVEVGERLPGTGGYILHGPVGHNAQPLEKLADFDAMVRRNAPAGVEIALLKFCYADITADADVSALFDAYEQVLSRLEDELPRIAFLHATVPLESDAPKDNEARSRYNALVREAYADTGRLWDLAAVESTTPDGRRVTVAHGKREAETLYPAYTGDGGHLNEEGARRAAEALLQVVVQHAR